MVRRICFMVMPYNVRETGVAPGVGPSKVDFNALWADVLHPAIVKLGYEPVRADMELGSLIIEEMIQRLAISDLVIADISISNANVYYEIGVRHAAKETGCVLLSADWAKPVFDVAQMRSIRYPMPVEKLAPDDAAKLADFLVKEIAEKVSGRSPVHDAVPGFPSPKVERAQAFTAMLEALADAQSRIFTTTNMPEGADRTQRALALSAEFAQITPISPALAIEALVMLRDCADFAAVTDFISRLPTDVQKLPLVQEQGALAMSKTGNHHDAIAALTKLIALRGETSERAGLIGGRFKKLYREAKKNDTTAAAAYLDRAIEWYTRGMYADLNDFYPTSNLPRLLRARGRAGDEEVARLAAAATRVACDRTIQLDPKQPWVRQTLLGQAVDTRDLDTVRRLVSEVVNDATVTWQLDSTDEDLRESIAQITDTAQRAEFEAAIAPLKKG
jgi:hypothetical protein